MSQSVTESMKRAAVLCEVLLLLPVKALSSRNAGANFKRCDRRASDSAAAAKLPIPPTPKAHCSQAGSCQSLEPRSDRPR